MICSLIGKGFAMHEPRDRAVHFAHAAAPNAKMHSTSSLGRKLRLYLERSLKAYRRIRYRVKSGSGSNEAL